MSDDDGEHLCSMDVGSFPHIRNIRHTCMLNDPSTNLPWGLHAVGEAFKYASMHYNLESLELLVLPSNDM